MAQERREETINVADSTVGAAAENTMNNLFNDAHVFRKKHVCRRSASQEIRADTASTSAGKHFT